MLLLYFFKLKKNTLNKKRDIENEIYKHFNRDQLKITNLKITANENLLIYTEDEEDKQLILENSTLFPNLRKLDLGDDISKKHILIVRGASSDDLNE